MNVAQNGLKNGALIALKNHSSTYTRIPIQTDTSIIQDFKKSLKQGQLFHTVHEYLEIISSNHIWSSQETWKIYTSFLETASKRIELDESHFDGFIGMLLKPHLKSNIMSIYSTPIMQPEIECLKMVHLILKDMQDLGIKESRIMISWRIVLSVLQKDYKTATELFDSGDEFNIYAYNAIISMYCDKIFLQRNTGDEKPIVTKRKLWSIVTGIRKSNQILSLEVLEYLLVLFGRHLQDGKATESIFQKLTLVDPKEFRIETFMVCFDALAFTNGDQKKFNKMLHIYKSHADVPRFGYLGLTSTFEPLMVCMTRYWVYQSKPNPCFKLLGLARKNNLEISDGFFSLLFEAAYLHSEEEPLVADEILQPLIRTYGARRPVLFEMLLLHYHRYPSSAARLTEFWGWIKNQGKFDQLHFGIDTWKAISSAFGSLGDQEGFNLLINDVEFQKSFDIKTKTELEETFTLALDTFKKH